MLWKLSAADVWAACWADCLFPQEDSEEGDTGRRLSEELLSEAEQATEDGEGHSLTFSSN